MRAMIRHRIGPLEAVGLRPLGRGLRQCWLALAGDPHTPPTQWDLSSLRIFRPRLGPLTWLGWRRPDRRAPILNLFNVEPAPRDAGYDVRVTFARDFRGGRLTYNGHMGVDFVVPVGTRVVAPAPAKVMRVENLMQRGGLKVVLDHGEGLVTLCNHLARAEVEPGQRVLRGEPLGLSGFSSVDGLLTFPWVPPHVHFTALLNGEPVDPFPAGGQPSLWRGGADPGPARPDPDEPGWAPTEWDADAIDASIAACLHPARRAELEALEGLEERAYALLYWRFFNYTAFDAHPPLYRRPATRRPRLDLPFPPDEVTGVALPG